MAEKIKFMNCNSHYLAAISYKRSDVRAINYYYGFANYCSCQRYKYKYALYMGVCTCGFIRERGRLSSRGTIDKSIVVTLIGKYAEC